MRMTKISFNNYPHTGKQVTCNDKEGFPEIIQGTPPSQ
jgi:hypothetical protein